MNDHERFLKKTARSENGCLEWQACRSKLGYGRFSLGGYAQAAHRCAWQLFRGAIPPCLNVLHRCDNRACVDPEHLFLGTQAVNVADCIAKGRFASHAGAANPNAVLAVEQVMAIRESTLTARELAEKNGCSKTAIVLAKAGKTWALVA